MTLSKNPSDVPDVLNPKVTASDYPPDLEASEPTEHPGECGTKTAKSAHGFLWLKAAAMAALFDSSPVKERREVVKLPELAVDEYTFGRASESLCKPLLAGRLGKGTRKLRKALQASERAHRRALQSRTRPDKSERRKMGGHPGVYQLGSSERPAAITTWICENRPIGSEHPDAYNHQHFN